jgi:hypothetical protein
MKGLTLTLALVVALAFASFGGSANPPTTVLVTTHGPPDDGTNSVQSISFDSGVSGGTFRLRFGIKSTSAIAWSPMNGTLVSHLQDALRAVPSIGSDGVNCEEGEDLDAGHGSVVCTFAGKKTAKLAVPVLSVLSNSLLGAPHLITVDQQVEGVTADARSYHAGAIDVDLDVLKFYVNDHDGPDVAWQAEPTPTPAPTPAPTPPVGIVACATWDGGTAITNWPLTGRFASMSKLSTGNFQFDFDSDLGTNDYSVFVTSDAQSGFSYRRNTTNVQVEFRNTGGSDSDPTNNATVCVAK